MSGSCGHGVGGRRFPESWSECLWAQRAKICPLIWLFSCVGAQLSVFFFSLCLPNKEERYGRTCVLCVTDRSFLWVPLPGFSSFLHNGEEGLHMCFYVLCLCFSYKVTLTDKVTLMDILTWNKLPLPNSADQHGPPLIPTDPQKDPLNLDWSKASKMSF